MSELVRLLQRKKTEGVGFEPTVGLTQRSISRGAFVCGNQGLTKSLPTIARRIRIIVCNIGKCWQCVRLFYCAEPARVIDEENHHHSGSVSLLVGDGRS